MRYLLSLICVSVWASATLPSVPDTASIAVSASTVDTTGSFHIQSRLHGINWSEYNNPLFSVGGYGLSSGMWGTGFAIADANKEGTGNCSFQLPVSDITVDITRDLTRSSLYPLGFVRGEIFNTVTGLSLGVCTFTITSQAPGSAIVNNGISLGYTNVTGGIAFLRWYPGASPANTAVPPYVSTPAPWLDYEFLASGTGADTSGHNQAIGGLNFASTPSYPPVCNAGTSQTIIRGTSLALDGSGSYALDGNPALTYSWSYIGPGSDGVAQTPIYSDTSAISPTVTGLTSFGSFNSQLTVTDSSAVQSTCIVHDGIVIANSRGAIDLTAEGLSPAQQFIVGPQVAFGYSLWPWADVAIANELNLQMLQLQPGGFYAPYWRVLQPGTITISAGSATVTGSGTAFKSLFCSGGNTSDGSFLTWRYPGTDGLTHYGQFQVVSCQDDTHLTLGNNFSGGASSFTYPSNPHTPWPNCATPCSGLGFGRADTAGETFYNWQYTGSPANYYDNVMFFLLGYWRSGVDTFYSGAQGLATYWMEWPILDYYYNCNSNLNNFSPGDSGPCPGESREIALTGMALWEQQPGNSYLLPSLENVGQKYVAYTQGLPTWEGLNDMRDDAYVFAGLATLSLVETNAAAKASYQSAIQASLGKLWTPYLRTTPFIGWNLFYCGVCSLTAVGGTGSVTVSPGSTIITGQGTAFYSGLVGDAIWTFPAPAAALPAYCGTCSTSGWVIGGDPKSYIITAVDPVAQTLTIGEPYSGTANLTARGFAIDLSSGIQGWGFQPYMMGLLATAFFMDAEAMAGYDTAAQAMFLSYGHIAVNLLTTLVTPDQGGFYNGVYFPGCTPPMYNTSTLAQLYCYGGTQNYQGIAWNSSTAFNAGDYSIFSGLQYQSLQANNVNHPPDPSGDAWWTLVPLMIDPGGDRQLTAEAMRAFSFDYQIFGTNAVTANLLMSNMFSKPGTGGPNPDGYYLIDYDAAAHPTGWYVSSLISPGTGDSRAKWAGQLAGFSEGAVTWAGIAASMGWQPPTQIKGRILITGHATQ